MTEKENLVLTIPLFPYRILLLKGGLIPEMTFFLFPAEITESGDAWTTAAELINPLGFVSYYLICVKYLTPTKYQPFHPKHLTFKQRTRNTGIVCHDYYTGRESKI